MYIAYEIDGTKTDHGLGYYDNCQVYMPSLELLYSYDVGDYVRAVYATSKTTNQRYIKDLVKVIPTKAKSSKTKKRPSKKPKYTKPKY